MWEHFQWQVTARGGTPTRFIQSEWGHYTGVWRPQGICLPLVCLWLAAQQRGVDFVADPYRPTFVQPVHQLAADFYSGPREWDSNYPDGALAPLGLFLENLRIVRPRAGTAVGDYDFTSEMREYLLYMPGAQYFVGFSGYYSPTSNEILTHTIGVDTIRCELFDPNVGKASFPGNVQGLCDFAKFWIDSYYRVTSPHLMVRRYVPAATASNRPPAPGMYQWAPPFRG